MTEPELVVEENKPEAAADDAQPELVVEETKPEAVADDAQPELVVKRLNLSSGGQCQT